MPRILLIDDDPDFSDALRGALCERDHAVDCLGGAERLLETLSQADYQLVLLDNRMPGLDGIEFLEILKSREIGVPVVLMTGDPTSETAIRAMNLGAFDYVVKPLELDDLVRELDPLIARAVDLVRSMTEHVRLPGPADSDDDAGDGPRMLGNSRPMREVYKQVGRVTGTDVPILILGETGTGKELVARAIHSNSPRHHRPFVAMNCTAMNENLLDGELFGSEPGAFTDARKLRKGKFEYADGGTLFLDEVGDMPPTLQAKLLRVLENKEVVRVGGNDTIRVDVRVVSATNRDLGALVRQGTFREDLLFRLNDFCIELPPLRERGPDDLRLLSEHFLRRMARSLGRPAVPALQPDAWQRLVEHPWPGNVRELQHVIGRAALVCRGSRITAETIDFRLAWADEKDAGGRPSRADAGTHILQAVHAALESGDTDLHRRLTETLERELLRMALAEYAGNKSHTAARLGLSLNGLRNKMRAHGLE